MNRQTFIAYAVALTLLCGVPLSGCSAPQSNASRETTAASEGTSTPPADTPPGETPPEGAPPEESNGSLTGIITGIDASAQMLTIRSMRGRRSRANGNPPENRTDKGDKNAKRESRSANETRESREHTKDFSNGETYQVTDQTVILDKDGNSITLSDLTEQTPVEYTCEGEVLLTITITDMPQREPSTKQAQTV